MRIIVLPYLTDGNLIIYSLGPDPGPLKALCKTYLFNKSLGFE